MLDCFVQGLSSNSLLPVLRIHQNHTNPCKSILVTNGSRCSDDVVAVFHDKASLRTADEKAFPIGGSLIPSRKRIQAQPGRNILLGHYANAHRETPSAFSTKGRIPEGRRQLTRSLSTIARVLWRPEEDEI